MARKNAARMTAASGKPQNYDHSLCSLKYMNTKRGHSEAKRPHSLFTFMCCVFVLCISFVLYCLYNALSHDSLSNLHEASNVCALHVVYIAVSLCAVLHAVLVDILHDRVQTSVNLLLAP